MTEVLIISMLQLFPFMRGRFRALNYFIWFNGFVVGHEKEGRMPKTSREGTRPSGTIVSFMNFTAR